jgi:hypothetical protein
MQPITLDDPDRPDRSDEPDTVRTTVVSFVPGTGPQVEVLLDEVWHPGECLRKVAGSATHWSRYIVRYATPDDPTALVVGEFPPEQVRIR